MSVPNLHAPLILPAYQIDGTPHSWKGRLPRIDQQVDLPILWFPDNLAVVKGNSTLVLGERGEVLPGRLLRPPRTLFGVSSSELATALTVTELDWVNLQGLHVTDYSTPFDGATGLTHFLPFRAGVIADPSEYVGGSIYAILNLDINDHYTRTITVVNNSIEYDLYTMNTTTREFEVTGTATYNDPAFGVFTDVVEQPGLAQDVASLVAALTRFVRWRLVIGVTPNVPSHRVITSIDYIDYFGHPDNNPIVLTGSANVTPPPVDPEPATEMLFEQAGAFFGDEAPNEHSLIDVFHIEEYPITDQVGYDALFALAQQTAAQIGDGAIAIMYDDEIELLSDIQAFFS